MTVPARNNSSASSRAWADTAIPLVSVEGTTKECGEQLGCMWKEPLQLKAEHTQRTKPWWKDRQYAPLVRKHAPHLPDLFRAMAAGAGIDEDLVGSRAPADDGGCTSWALHPSTTLDGIPISGQSKDVSRRRGMQLLVLRVKMSDAPSMLTLTYPGWLFGHGFVKGGTSIFRNSLFVAKPESGLPYAAWGLLALHCRSVDDVRELTERWGCDGPGHATVADERGGILGVESGSGGPGFLAPRKGIYTHANRVLSRNGRLLAAEIENVNFKRSDSSHRTNRMRELLEQNVGRLTVPLAHAAMTDHTNWPRGICRHESDEAQTGGMVIVEPTRGTLYATRGAPCRSLLQKFQL